MNRFDFSEQILLKVTQVTQVTFFDLYIFF